MIFQDHLDRFGAEVVSCSPAAGERYWRIVEARHVGHEFGGNQHVFVSARGEDGGERRGDTVRFWRGDNAAEETKTLDKRAGERYGADIVINWNDTITAQMDGFPSDFITGLHTRAGEFNGGYRAHHSFYVAWRLTSASAGNEVPETVSPATHYQMRTTDALNLRQHPALGAPVIATLPEGATVTAWGETARANRLDWLQVKHEEHGAGWVASKHLTEAQQHVLLPIVNGGGSEPPAASNDHRSEALATLRELQPVELLARLLDRECGGQPAVGMMAVAASVLTRVADGRWGATLHDVILSAPAGMRLQYDPVYLHAEEMAGTPASQRALLMAVRAFDGWAAPVVFQRATHFHATSMKRPDSWRDMDFLYTIAAPGGSGHRFYREG